MKTRSIRPWLTLAVAVLVALQVPAAGSPRPPTPGALLPDLVPLPPFEVIGPGTEFMIPLGVDAPLIVDGCYLDERVRKGAKRCLRFDSIVGNVGEGAFELAYAARATGRPPRGAVALQRIFNSDGSYTDRFAVRTELHPTHAHFHVQDFYVASLWRATEGGVRLPGAAVANGDKNGFCPEDSARIDGEEGHRTYSCFTAAEPEGDRALQVVGVSSEWMDVYTASLPDQYVEISGVRDGHYLLELELDPHDVFREADEHNNVLCVHIQLEGVQAQIVQPEVPC